MSRQRLLLFVVIALAGAFAWWLLARRAHESAELARSPLIESQALGTRDAALEATTAAEPERVAVEPRDVKAEPVAASTDERLHFFGRAVDAANGAPIAGLDVEVGDTVSMLRRAPPTDASTDAQAAEPLLTDAGGFFEVAVARDETAFACLRGPGWSSAYRRIGAGHESVDRALRIEMLRPAALELSARGVADSPVPDVEVRVTARAWDLLGSDQELPLLMLGAHVEDELRWTAITAADGRCRLEDLPPNIALQLALLREERPLPRHFDPLLLTNGETRSIDVRIGTGARLEGLALDARGAAIPALEVWLVNLPAPTLRTLCFTGGDDRHRTTKTDGLGHFHFDDLTVGGWAVGPRPGPTEDRQLWGIAPAQPFAIVAGEELHRIELRIPDPLYVRGHVVGPAGERVADVSISASGQTVDCWTHAESNADGNFAIGPLPEGSYELSVDLALDSRGYSAPEPLSVQAGETNAWIRLSTGCSIAGVVRDLDGLPTGAIRYAVHRVGSANAGFMAGLNFSSSDNDFRAGGLVPGTYNIVARAGDLIGGLTGVQLAAAQQLDGLDLRVDRGATLRLRRPSGAAAYWYTVECAGVAVASGAVGSDAASPVLVVPGDVLVRAGASPFALSQEVRTRVAVGEDRELVLADP